MFCAVLYFLHTGSAWRSMPPEFPPWRTVHEYFTQWTMLRDGDRTLLEQALEPVRVDLLRLGLEDVAAAARLEELVGLERLAQA